MLLGIMGAAQGTITTIGDLPLGVQTVNAPLFVLTGAITSLVYLSITFALSTTFMHIGKGLCVALVIVQIPGASGLYPIEMMPKFFRMVYPFVPFSYRLTRSERRLTASTMGIGSSQLARCCCSPWPHSSLDLRFARCWSISTACSPVKSRKAT